ncbi:MAG: sugar phosphate isomerase/epimerase family protein [Planctomycetota bacterium]
MNQAKIQVAAMSLIWNNPKGEDFLPWLAEVKELGYDGITGFADWGWEQYVTRPDEFARMVADHGLQVASVDAFIGAEPERYHQICRFMEAQQSENMVLVGDSAEDWGGDYDAFADALNQIGGIAREHGITAYYHHHTGAVGETFAQTREVLARIDPDKVGIMAETGHATKDFSDLPLEERAPRFFREYGERISFIEFKDWHPDTGLDTPLGEGLCNFDKVVDLIGQIGYEGWILVEQNGCDGTHRHSSFTECARISREFIRQKLGV